MSVIRLENVDLLFQLWKEKRIKDVLIPGKNRGFNEFNKDNGLLHAIQNVSLTIQNGERVAIIGHNGAGKSTLLKIISGIYPPTSGTLQVEGRISSMFELATGFEMEQSGWDNIYLRGLMLGETPQSIREKMEEIAAFSELGDFLNVPVKYYSSGMFVRLSFSVSTAIRPDILLLDEVVSAGDASFIQKANRRMKEMMAISNIMVLVTHSMADAVEMCSRCVWLDKGRILMDGDPGVVTGEYLKKMRV